MQPNKSRVLSGVIITGLLSILFQNITAQKLNFPGEILHNGITLPYEWPPRYPEPEQPKSFPVPYLVSKPDIININTGRQLFIDSFLISKTNLKTVIHKPDYYSGNPVLLPEMEWEKTISGVPYAIPFSDGIWYDELDHKFKMWYLAGAGIMNDEKKRFYTCYAESDDGKSWIRMVSDLVPNTSVVDTFSRDASTIWLDKLERDPLKRFKMFLVALSPEDQRYHYMLKYSRDGIHWTQPVAVSDVVNDRSTAFYNPFRSVWCLSMRTGTPVSNRSRTYLENSNPETAVLKAHRIRKGDSDEQIVYWIYPDSEEPDNPEFPEVKPGVYNFDAIAYESIFIGQYSIWQGPENKTCAELGIPKKNEVFLGFSRDGFHFSRPSHEPFLGIDETKGAWNNGNVQSIIGTPLIVRDSLYFYSSGRMQNSMFWDGFASTGLATLRRDGFVSMNAGKEEGFLVTEKLSFDGMYLFINAEIRKSLRVEILDEDGRFIDGFTKNDSKVLRKFNSTSQLITWEENKDLSSLEGRIIRLKFYLKDGDLYSFWISPWISGESRGYTGGGGPELSSSGLDVPNR